MNKKYTAKFKASVALEAIKGDKTISHDKQPNKEDLFHDLYYFIDLCVERLS